MSNDGFILNIFIAHITLSLLEPSVDCCVSWPWAHLLLIQQLAVPLQRVCFCFYTAGDSKGPFTTLAQGFSKSLSLVACHKRTITSNIRGQSAAKVSHIVQLSFSVLLHSMRLRVAFCLLLVEEEYSQGIHSHQQEWSLTSAQFILLYQAFLYHDYIGLDQVCQTQTAQGAKI